ncbi:hypothetical protein C8F04DRAFT_1263464 [Mycena alexandri]|uniref:Uncharacterized protein n=1 Tax=Mycena alexandri TaxID=1745969 RepID=A0AAD6WX74_9AGAR|nr:hypothetical protein C8F04DRAFT_1263464 [Mycena alexandri]
MAEQDVVMTAEAQAAQAAQVPMTDQQFAAMLAGPKSYNPTVRGWTKELVRANHKDYVLKELDQHPGDCMAAVFLTPDFKDRARGPGIIRRVLMGLKVRDADKIETFPPIPKEEVVGVKGMSMPWTNIITNCTASFITSVMANPFYCAIDEGSPTAFYCFKALPETPWIFAVYVGFTDTMVEEEFKSIFWTKLLNSPAIMQLIRDDHGNFSGDHSPAIILRAALHFAEIRAFPVYRGGNYDNPAITAHSIMFPPISNDPDMSKRLQQYIMAPGFRIDGERRGEASPWLGGSNSLDPKYQKPMVCTDCRGIDHYKDRCPLTGSVEYLNVHGIHVDTASMSIPTSLAIGAAPSSNEWTPVYRGASRGRTRGGGHRGRANEAGGGNGYSRGFGRGGYKSGPY